METVRAEKKAGRMTYIGAYAEVVQEFSPEIAHGLPKMADSLSPSPIENKDTIVKYLRNGEIVSMCTGTTIKDVLSGETVNCSDNGRSDGKYRWGEALAYYVEKYDLMLPEDFVQHIMEQTAA